MQTKLSVKISQYLDMLPPKLQEEVLAFIEFLIFRQKSTAKQKENKPEKKGQIHEGETPNEKASKLRMITLPNGKHIPVTPADESVSVKELFGIWENRHITAEELRNQAWGERL